MAHSCVDAVRALRRSTRSGTVGGITSGWPTTRPESSDPPHNGEIRFVTCTSPRLNCPVTEIKYGNIPRDMIASGSTSQYVLGSTDAEQERLIRQAARLDPYTERLFRDAGMGPGQRILDIGSGVGDVAMLAARLVGPSGEIVGVERDVRSIARARARVAEAGLHNVMFIQSDVSQVTSNAPFDAVVGRCILQFLPDAAAVYVPCRGWSDPEACSLFTSRRGPLCFCLPPNSRCGRRALRSFARPSNALEQTQTWNSCSSGGSKRLACLRRTCGWKSPWEMMRFLQDGSAISCAVFAHRCCSTIFPASRWAIS